MKQLNTVTKLFFVALLCAAGSVKGQYIAHPLAFDVTTTPNWYKNYVGLVVQATVPAAIAGQYTYTTANDGSGGTGEWGGVVTTPLINVPVIMGSGADSFGCSAFTFSMTGKIAVIWRGPISAPCDFACKAYNAQMAGAVAVIIINEYAGQPPVLMGAGTTCTGITIPVFMIGNPEGLALSGQYRSGATVTITISPWGSGKVNDLGLIQGGGAAWHNYAYPSNQISNNAALNQTDGAFIANFGTHDATNVKLSAYLGFTPTGGSTSLIHADSVTFSATTSTATYPFKPLDSVLSIFTANEYTLAGLGSGGVGRYDLAYRVSSDSADENLADNTAVYSFYATDSLYSKGRYDFTNQKPITGNAFSFGTAGSEFIWGPMYFVGPQSGTAIEKIQYSLHQNSGGTTPTTVILDDATGNNNVMVFKWVDGDPTNIPGNTPDSLLQDGELTLVSLSTYNFDGLNDTSGALLELKRTGGAGRFVGNAAGDKKPVFLDPNSWYYVAVDVPASASTTSFFLGVDNVLSPYPRIYGRFHASNGLLDYSNVITNNTELTPTAANPTNPNVPCANAGVSFVNAIDSFNFRSIVGAVPAVALVASNHPDTTTPPDPHVGVNNVYKSPIELSVYPNPASDYLNVSVNLDHASKVVSYEVVDGLGRFVSKELHYNVQKEVYALPTSKLPSGNYYLIVNANGAVQGRKFTVVR